MSLAPYHCATPSCTKFAKFSLVGFGRISLSQSNQIVSQKSSSLPSQPITSNCLPTRWYSSNGPAARLLRWSVFVLCLVTYGPMCHLQWMPLQCVSNLLVFILYEFTKLPTSGFTQLFNPRKWLPPLASWPPEACHSCNINRVEFKEFISSVCC